MKELLPLMLWRAALLSLSFLALSCKGGGNGNQKDPPQVILTVPKPNVAGPKITTKCSSQTYAVRLWRTGCGSS